MSDDSSLIHKDSLFSVLNHEDEDEDEDDERTDRSEGDEDGLQLTTLNSDKQSRTNRKETVSPLQKVNWSVLPLSKVHIRDGHKYASLNVEDSSGGAEDGADSSDSIDRLKISSTHSHHNTVNTPTLSVNPSPSSKPSSMNGILASSDVRHLFGIYLAISFLVMFNDEAVPLWGATSLQRGGLAWDSAEVGDWELF
jgi:hypothetical protein